MVLSTQFSYATGPLYLGRQIDNTLVFEVDYSGQGSFLAGVNIGTMTAEPSAVLNINSVTRGLLIPRMTTAQRNAIATPAAGLQIYNTSTSQLNFFDGSNWQALGVSGSGVTSVSSANSDISVATGSTTPVLTLNSGTTGGVGDANKIAKLNASGQLTSAMIPNLDTGKLTTGTLPIARGGTNSSAVLSNNRVMVSSGGAIVESSAITASRALVSDANGLPVASSVTSTELGYLSGVTSSLQTQLSSKLSATVASPSSGQVLRYNGSNWINAAIDAATDFSGILPVANGGTGVSSLGSGNILIGNGTGSVDTLAAGSAGNIVYATGLTNWGSGSPDAAGLVDKSSTQTISGAKAFSNYVQMNAQNEVRFADSDSSNYVSLRAPAAVGSNVTLTLPTTAGASGQVLSTNGSGELNWVDPIIAGGGGTVWQMIASYDFPAAATSYTFTGLDGDTDVEYMVVTRFRAGVNGPGSFRMHPNGDTSTSNFNSQYLFGLGSSAGAAATTHAGILVGHAGTNAGTVSYGLTYFYAKSGNGPRSGRTTYSQGVTTSTVTAALLHDTVWNNTSANVTSLGFSTGTANGIGAGSRIEIWAKRSWSGQSQWLTNGANIHLPSGNVGIGTSTPNTKLVVSGGNITSPNQTFFEAKLCSSVVAQGGTMVWETEITDTTSSYNHTNGVFTAPVTGVYQFGFNTLLNYAGSGEYRYGFHKNGALENIIIEQKAASTWKTIQGTWTTRLTAGETVSVVYGFGTGNTYNDCNFNRFWGRLEN